MIELPQCRWRGKETVPEWVECHSAKLRTGPRGVTHETCANRCPFVDHEPLPKKNRLRPLPVTPSPLPCIHEGPVLEWCNHCNNDLKHVRECDLHERCTRGYVGDRVRSCLKCGDYDSGAGVRFPVRFDENNLCVGVPGKRFNSSLIRWKYGYLFAFRNGWMGSEIFVVQLSKKFEPVGGCHQLNLFHRQANYGREDPRLFLFRGRLHVAYIGVTGRWGPTNMMYARLSDDFQTEQIFAPRYAGRQPWEKNWDFFEHGGELYAVYSIKPHTILRVDGEHAEVVFTTSTGFAWSGGLLRGGAPPVLVGDTWYHFFHGKVGSNNLATYNTGCYTFENKPPFRILSMTPNPITVADWSTKPADQYCAVNFVCGAVAESDRWILSMGIHDRWSEIHEFSREDIDSKLCS